MIRFEFSADIPPMAHYHRSAVEQIAACVHERTFCALLGPRLSGKTLILNYIDETLARQFGWNTVYLDLSRIRATTQQAFFSDLIALAAVKLGELNGGEPVPLPEGPASSSVFRAFLLENVARLDADLVVLIDPLEALPIDLVQALLTSLRAAYMDQQAEENHLIAIVSGALSLAELTVGESSPFRGIARRIFIGDLDGRQSRELIEAFFERLKVRPTRQAVEKLLAAAAGDLYLIRTLVNHGARMVRDRSDPRLRARDVRRMVRRFLKEEVLAYAPLQEAVRLIEESPDLVQCIRALIEEETVPRARLPLPLSPDLDPLYLTGVVESNGKETYRLQNTIYREFLCKHFSPERIGHLLTLAGKWDLALEYLETQVQGGSRKLRTDLILATINSILASADLAHAVHYFLRCLCAAFNIREAKVWHRPPRLDHLVLVGQLSANDIHGAFTDRPIALHEDMLEARAFRLGAGLRGPEMGDAILRALPLSPQGSSEPIGVVTIGESLLAADNTAIRERDLELNGFIHQAARALEIVVERRQELAFAGQLQASLLPEEWPQPPGWEIAASWLPARETSGDFYDFFELPGGKVGILIADVVDKGMGAALMMALGRTMIRTFVEQMPDAPDEVLRATNDRLRSDLNTGTMITLFYGVLDPSAGTLNYVNAGHLPPRLFAADRHKEPAMLRPTGVPLGMFDGSEWTAETVTMDRGALLLMYTDGVPDTLSETNLSYDAGRMISAVRRAGRVSATAARDALLDDLALFRGAMPRYDDVTVVVVGRA